MNAQRLIEMLSLPIGSRVDQKVPKTVLSEHAATTAADRRAIKDNIEGLWWLASLKPNTIGVPPFADDQREYLEIAVLHFKLRGTLKSAKSTRLIELLHRAIPYPVLLVTEQEDALSLSLAHKRWAQNEKDKMVLEDGYPHTTEVTGDAPEAFFHDLALDRQPHIHLFALYQGWLACLVALDAWQETGHYRALQGIDRLPESRQHLHKARELAHEIARLRKQAAKERQMARQVELNLQIKQLEAQRSALLEQLAQGV